MELLKLDIQMFSDGKIVISTELDTKNFENGINTMQNKAKSGGAGIKSIVAGLGITKLIGSAFNMISSSMDSAIKRVDTLNNFSKVMSNLGVSANDADKAIKLMSKELSGLPTTLDQGAMAVQRFTSKNGDVGKSTDMFLALNNALLAGGASSEIQASAMEQLSQAYAKGKPDMMEWRSMLSAMPAQATQLGKAFGMSSDELGEALRKGDISMDEFMAKVIELNKNGIDGFESFAVQAKNSVGGIGNAITVAKTQVVKGVASLIQAIENGLKDAGLPSLGKIISNIGDKAREVLNTIAKYIPKVIGVLKQVYEWVKKNKDIIGGIVIAVGAFIATFKTIKTVIAIINGVKTAMALLNAVMLANPITLIVAAIGALVAGFIYLWNTSDDFRQFWIDMWEGIKSIVGGAIEFVVNLFNTVVDFIKNNWQGLLLLIVNPFAGAFKLLYDNVEGFRNFINNAVTSILDFFKSIPKKVSEFVHNVIEFFKELPYNIGFAIGELIGYIIKWKDRLVEFITKDVPEFINGVINWFKQLPGKIWEFILQVVDKIKQWGTNLINFAKTEIPRFINAIIDWFKQLPGKIWTWLVNVVSKIGEWITNMKNKASDGIKQVVNKIIDGFKSLPGKLLDTGRNIVEGLWNGIRNAGSWIKSKVKEFAKGILDGMKSALGIRSPSRLFRDEVGLMIAKGIGVGFEEGIDDVYKDMQDAIDLETSKMSANVQSSGTYQMAMANTPTFNLVDNATNKTQLTVDGKVLAEVVNTENRNREVAKA